MPVDHFEFMPISLVDKEYHFMKNMLNNDELPKDKSHPDKDIKDSWWNVNWIPIADNGSGDFICIDTDPAAGGKKGQIIIFYHDDAVRKLLSNSFEEWFYSIVNKITNSSTAVEAFMYRW